MKKSGRYHYPISRHMGTMSENGHIDPYLFDVFINAKVHLRYSVLSKTYEV